MPDKICGDVHKFVGSPWGKGDKHPLHGEEIQCTLDPDHEGNHVGKAKDGTPVAWERLVQVFQSIEQAVAKKAGRAAKAAGDAAGSALGEAFAGR